MIRKHTVSSLKNQDKLEEGLIRTMNGIYVPISSYGKRIYGSWQSFAEIDEQDKLKEGLIKIGILEEYLPVDNLDEIESSSCFVATAVYGDVMHLRLKL